MRILVITPEPPETTLGNSITAMRWTGILRTLGHHVEVTQEWDRQDVDLLVALHARRSHPSIVRFRLAYPERPLIVALTGTDLYRDLPADPDARRSLALATRIVALQDAARAELDDEARAKTCIIYQSAEPPVDRMPPAKDLFEVCVLSHLRDVKDPLRAAFALRLLPPQSRVRIVHAGRALDPELEAEARAEEIANPRYRWIGEQPHNAAMQLLARSRLLVLSSTMEGGASAIAEAVACGVPVLCSNIPGNLGMLGRGYPGFFRLKDTGHLAGLLVRAETDPNFIGSLKESVRKLQPRFAPEGELAAWKHLLLGIKPSE